MVDLGFNNKHAVVCGGTRGIGRATAELLAQEGAEITLIARNAEALGEVKDHLSSDAGQIHAAIVADFNDAAALAGIMEKHADRLKTATILINNSGGPPGGLAINAAPAEFIIAFQRHLLAAQVLTQALVPVMRKQKFGRIVNVISTSVKSPIPGLGVSNTIRGAVANWSKTLAAELGPDGITVNNVLPGATATDRLEEIIHSKASKAGKSIEEISNRMMAEIPAGRFARPEETAAAIAFLCSDLASYINGINLPVDGGRLSCL